MKEDRPRNTNQLSEAHVRDTNKETDHKAIAICRQIDCITSRCVSAETVLVIHQEAKIVFNVLRFRNRSYITGRRGDTKWEIADQKHFVLPHPLLNKHNIGNYLTIL